MPALELEHHPSNVFVILVPLQELQALLRIAPLQDFDRLLARAPGIHFALVRHVKVDRVPPRKRPAVIFHAVILSCGKQAKDGAGRPARPVSRGAADLGRFAAFAKATAARGDRDGALHAASCLRHAFHSSCSRSRFFH